ncbi:MAG: hypothetical protein QM762_08685 [Chryseolinea sp.]
MGMKMSLPVSARLLTLSTMVACCGTAMAQSVNKPEIKDGDTWAYNVTEEKNTAAGITSMTRKWENTVARAGSKTFSLTAKQLDSTNLPKEFSRSSDWSNVANVNGKPTMLNHPYDFPMTPGKEWQVEYTTDNPDPRTKIEKVVRHYAVVGWTDIKVPAGTFHALKVEMEGEWFKEFNEVGPHASSMVTKQQGNAIAVAQTSQASTPKPVSGKLYQAYWYVPEIKSHVKLIVEDYQAGGALNSRITEELASVHVN